MTVDLAKKKFLDLTQNMTNERKIDELDFIKSKSVCDLKDIT